MKRLLVGSMIVAVALGAAGIAFAAWPSASADDEPTPPTADRRDSSAMGPVPAAVLLTGDGREVAGGAGTRCWGTMCVDMVGPITNDAPFRLGGGGFSIRFEAGPPTSTSAGWFRAEGLQSEPSEAGRLWTFPVQLLPGQQGAAPPNLEPGLYVFVVQAFYQGRGDIMYGFYVQVE